MLKYYSEKCKQTQANETRYFCQLYYMSTLLHVNVEYPTLSPFLFLKAATRRIFFKIFLGCNRCTQLELDVSAL